MKFLKLISAYLITFFFFSNFSLANNSISYADIEYILENSNAGKSLLKKLEKKENEKFNQFKLEEQNLKNSENKILASKNIISEAQCNIDVSNFQKKLKNNKDLKKEELDKLNKIRNDEILNFLKLINSHIEQYMVDNSISVILDRKNIYLANKNLDITSNLIDLINKNIK